MLVANIICFRIPIFISNVGSNHHHVSEINIEMNRTPKNVTGNRYPVIDLTIIMQIER